VKARLEALKNPKPGKWQNSIRLFSINVFH